MRHETTFPRFLEDQHLHPENYERCEKCKGEGIIERDIAHAEVGWVAELTQCDDCEGTGKILTQAAFDALAKSLGLL